MARLRSCCAWGASGGGAAHGRGGLAGGHVDGRALPRPAVPATIVDVTGGGNAYIGGFLVGLGEGLGVVDAAARAAVSASFTLEQFGVPQFTPEKHAEALRRLDWALARIENI